MKLIIVGGFLGAGKTTLLADAAARLTQQGFAVGLITNDQAPDLVDTAILTHLESDVREVAGSCFCCNFDGFRGAVASLENTGADIVIAEPVGSCTDLSATIMQPLKEMYREYELAPLSVLIDPGKARDVLMDNHSRLHADAAYILRLQLEEADEILLTKCDTLPGTARDELVSFLANEFSPSNTRAISTRTGEGVDEWLDSALKAPVAGIKIAEVDYDRYANGEAVLGWLNATVKLRWIGGLDPDWPLFLTDFAVKLQDGLRTKDSEIGHIKMLLDCGHGRITLNLTTLDDTAQAHTSGGTGRLNASLTVNARAQSSPEVLDARFRDALSSASYARVAAAIATFHCIRPGRPVPTHRHSRVV